MRALHSPTDRSILLRGEKWVMSLPRFPHIPAHQAYRTWTNNPDLYDPLLHSLLFWMIIMVIIPILFSIESMDKKDRNTIHDCLERNRIRIVQAAIVTSTSPIPCQLSSPQDQRTSSSETVLIGKPNPLCCSVSAITPVESKWTGAPPR